MGKNGRCSDTLVAAMDHPRQGRRREIYRSNFTCISPWFIISRWFNGGKPRNRFMEKKMIVGDLETPSFPAEDVLEVHREKSFNCGVGFGLIYLLAASRNELDKMTQLQTKVELLLQNLQTDFPNQEKFEQPLMPSQSCNSSFSTTVVQETFSAEENSSGQYLSSSYVQQDENKSDILQFEMDTQVYLKCSRQPCTEVRVEESAPEWSNNTCFEEHQDINNYNEYCGVPPRELERKLHELLEARQQERIDELESSLDYAKQQLEQKEKELCWWKDTARLIAQHLSTTPNLKLGTQHREPEFDVREMDRSSVKNYPSGEVQANYRNVGAEF